MWSFLGRSEYKESNKNLSLVPKMHYDQLYDQCFSFKVNQLSPVWLYLWLIAPGQEKNNNKTLKQKLFRTHFLWIYVSFTSHSTILSMQGLCQIFTMKEIKWWSYIHMSCIHLLCLVSTSLTLTLQKKYRDK